jgi:hypothetical protein
MKLVQSKSLGAPIAAAALCPAMDLLAIASSTQVSVYRNRTHACLVTLPIADTVALRWSPSSGLLAVCTVPGDVHLLHADSAEVVRAYRSASPNAKTALHPSAPRVSVAGRLVDAAWIATSLRAPLPSVSSRVLSMPTPPLPTPGTPAGPAVGRLALLHHALQHWQSGQACVLAVADDQGTVVLLLDGVAQVRVLSFTALASRIVQLWPTSSAELIVVTRKRSASTSSAGAVFAETPSTELALSFADLAPILAHVAAPTQLKSLLTTEYLSAAESIMVAADTAWRAAVTRIVVKAVGVPDNISEARASLMSFVFRPEPRAQLECENPDGGATTSGVPGASVVNSAAPSGQPSAAASSRPSRQPSEQPPRSRSGLATDAAAGAVPSAATSAAGSRARRRSLSSRGRGPRPTPRTPTPTNRGSGRGPTSRSLAASPPELGPGDVAALQEQIQASFVEAAAMAIDQAQRALSLALEYAADLPTPQLLARVLSSTLADDQPGGPSSNSAEPSRAPRTSGGPDAAPPRQTLSSSGVSRGAHRSSVLAEDATVPMVIQRAIQAVDQWVRNAATERAAVHTLILAASASGSCAYLDLTATDVAALFRLLTSLLPNSADEMAVLSEVFEDELLSGGRSTEPFVTAGCLDALSAAVARTHVLLADISAAQSGRTAAPLPHQVDPELHEGLTVLESAEGAGVDIADSRSMIWSLAATPPPLPSAAHVIHRDCDVTDRGVPGSSILSVTTAQPLECRSIQLTANTQFGCMHPRLQAHFDPATDDVAATLESRSATLQAIASCHLFEAADGPAAALVATVPRDKNSADGAVTLWRLGVTPDADDGGTVPPVSRLKLVINGLMSSGAGQAGAGHLGAVRLEVAERRGFALLICGQRYVLVDLMDDEEDSGESRGADDEASEN